MAKKAYIGVDEYTRLEYIESTGTQYIDTGFMPYAYKQRVVLTMMLVRPQDANSVMYFCGNKSAVNAASYGLCLTCSSGALVSINVGDNFPDRNPWRFDASENVAYTLDVSVDNGTYTAIRDGYATTGLYSGYLGTDTSVTIFGLNTGSAVSGMGNGYRLYSFQIYDHHDNLVRDYIPVLHESGEVGLYDLVGGKFYPNNGTGTFVAGNATSGKIGIAHKVKREYIGIGGVARRVKKAYIGVGGVARPWWGGGTELAYYGTITPLSVGRYYLAAAKVGDYALFGGGYASAASAVVEAYDKKLTRTIPTALSAARHLLAGASVGNYAIFSGGLRSVVVDAYDASLTRTTPAAFSYARGDLAATTVGGYALFGGGGKDFVETNIVDAYDTSLTRTTPTPLSASRYRLAATTVGGYALFGGGYYTNSKSSQAVVDAYDASLTRTLPTPLSVARQLLAATTVGDFALFGGGTEAVDAYDKSLTRSLPPQLSTGRAYLSATTVGECALFGCGSGSPIVDVYNASLERTTPQEMSAARNYYAAVSIGEYALFGGGSNSTDIVEAYTIV